MSSSLGSEGRCKLERNKSLLYAPEDVQLRILYSGVVWPGGGKTTVASELLEAGSRWGTDHIAKRRCVIRRR